MRALIEEKKKGHKITRAEEPADTTNVVDLMAALKKSLAGSGRALQKKTGNGTVSPLPKRKSKR